MLRPIGRHEVRQTTFSTSIEYVHRCRRRRAQRFQSVAPDADNVVVADSFMKSIVCAATSTTFCRQRRFHDDNDTKEKQRNFSGLRRNAENVVVVNSAAISIFYRNVVQRCFSNDRCHDDKHHVVSAVFALLPIVWVGDDDNDRCWRRCPHQR